MNKTALIKKVIARLTDELEVYFRAAEAARHEATHEQSKAEHKYDTRGLEASYLARGQSRQAAELEATIAMFSKMEARKFQPGEPIDVGALVEMEYHDERMYCFMAAKAGGTEVEMNKKEIMVITPQSPLGEQLQGKKQGDQFQVTLAGARHPCRIVSVE